MTAVTAEPHLALPAVDDDPTPGTGAEHDDAYDTWAERRDARLRTAHKAWRRNGCPTPGLVALVAEALADSPWSEQDVAGWIVQARRVGKLSHPSPAVIIGLARVDLVPNAPLRDAYLDAIVSGTTTPATVATAAGYTTTRDTGARRRQADIGHLERTLGTQAHPTAGTVRVFIPYTDAVTLARVLDLPPYAAGV